MLFGQAVVSPGVQRRESADDPSKFLSAMDASIAENKRVSFSLMKDSPVTVDQKETLEKGNDGIDVSTNVPYTKFDKTPTSTRSRW